MLRGARLAILSAALLAGGAEANQLDRLTEGPIAGHPAGSLTVNLACAGVLFAVTEHYTGSGGSFSGAHGRDALEKMMFAFRKDAIGAFYAENGLSTAEGAVTPAATGVIANGVFETVKVFSFPYQFRLAPHAGAPTAAISAAIQADVDHCVGLHGAAK